MAQTTNGQDISRTDVGNGTQLQFTAPLPYTTISEIYVYLWELNTSSGLYEWVLKSTPNDYTFANAGVIEFTTAPAVPPTGVTTNIRIIRSTSVSEPRAVFEAGSAIRAQDLNNNFNQLIAAAQEAANDIDQIQIEIDNEGQDLTQLQQNVATNTSNIATNTSNIATNTASIVALEAGAGLPIASATVLGGIKVGDNLSINQDGLLSATGGGGGVAGVSSISPGDGISVNQTTGDVVITATYALPNASASVLGGIKVGNNLSIDANGVLSASGGGGGGGAVDSVNGKTGTVVLTAADVSAIPLNDWSSLPQVTP
tara:strand:+ start:2008 stop:2949 length:942 start_codon:yes stop_codon:yes gene_type:complete